MAVSVVVVSAAVCVVVAVVVWLTVAVIVAVSVRLTTSVVVVVAVAVSATVCVAVTVSVEQKTFGRAGGAQALTLAVSVMTSVVVGAVDVAVTASWTVAVVR